jgi:hypothetical protein
MNENDNLILALYGFFFVNFIQNVVTRDEFLLCLLHLMHFDPSLLLLMT